MSTGTERAQNYDADRRRAGDRGEDGKSGAAERLLDDSREANRGSNGGQFDNQAVAKLEEQGLLPQLAIEFTRSADESDLDGDGDTSETVFSAIDTDGENGITDDELQVARTSENASVLDKRLLQQLGNDYEDLRYTTVTEEEGISQDDINSYISTQDAALSNDTQVREAAARLLLNPDLFDLADTAKDGGTGDGHVSKDDLETLIDKYESGELPDSVTQEDIDAMQFLVDNWDESYVGGDNSGIRDTEDERDTQSGDGLTRASIKIGLGLPNDGTGDQQLFDQVNAIDPQFGQQYAEAYTTRYGQEFPTSAGDDPGASEDPVHTTDENGAQITTYQGNVTEVAYSNGEARDFGYDEEGTLISYKDVNDKVYDYVDGAWVGTDGEPAPFSDVSVDQSGNVTVTTDGVAQVYDTTGNPAAGADQPTTSTDANGASITTDRGNVTEIRYADGQVRDFGYDESNTLVSYKDVDGTVYDNANGTWTNAATGEPAPFSNVSVDEAGQVTITNVDGSVETIATNNERMSEPEAESEPEMPETEVPEVPEPEDNSVETYTVQAGQGFDRIARDVYTQAFGHPPSIQEEIALSELIAAANDNSRDYSGGAIHPGDVLVVPNLDQLSQAAEQQGVSLETYIRNASAQIVADLQAEPMTDSPMPDMPAEDGAMLSEGDSLRSADDSMPMVGDPMPVAA